MRIYRLLILDFDGVLSNSLQICMEEVNRLRVEFPGLPEVHSRTDMVKLFAVQLRHSLHRFGLDDALTKRFFDEHSGAMSHRSHEIEPFYGAVSALVACSLSKIIVTSSYSAAVHDILRKCSDFHKGLIQHVYGREEQKSKTEKIRDALQTFDADVSEALYIGDLASDVLYCREVPVDIACVGYGYHPTEYLRQFNPTYILETEDEFVAFISRLKVNSV